MIKLAISGCCGRMGSRITELARKDNTFTINALIEKKGHPKIGTLWEGIPITDNPDEIRNADCLIEFTLPEVTLEHLQIALKYGKAVVIGTTGLTEEQKGFIKTASRQIPIALSPNMSIGVNVLFKLVREASNALKGYRVNIVEAHHIHKKDTPSGTAKRIAEIVKEISSNEVTDIKSIREGEIIGDHEVTFDSPLDTIKLSHLAKTRDIFAEGALCAAKWLIKKKNGLFDMQDIIKYHAQMDTD